MRIARGERDRVLRIAARTLVDDLSNHLDQLRPGARQIDEIETQRVRRELDLAT